MCWRKTFFLFLFFLKFNSNSMIGWAVCITYFSPQSWCSGAFEWNCVGGVFLSTAQQVWQCQKGQRHISVSGWNISRVDIFSPGLATSTLRGRWRELKESNCKQQGRKHKTIIANVLFRSYEGESSTWAVNCLFSCNTFCLLVSPNNMTVFALPWWICTKCIYYHYPFLTFVWIYLISFEIKCDPDIELVNLALFE